LSRPPLGANQPFIHWVTTLQQPEREYNYLPTSSAEVKNEWSYTSTPVICFHGFAQGKFYFFLTLHPFPPTAHHTYIHYNVSTLQNTV
jgi:hypothetical protein